jgi:hypothetical protein
LGSLFGYIGKIDLLVLFWIAMNSIVFIMILSLYFKRGPSLK